LAAELKPEPPALEWVQVAPERRFVSKRLQECNYLQALEGGIDSSHVTFLHGGALRTDPLFVGGKNTFVDDLFVVAGAQNAVQVERWPQYAIESVVASPPDIILHSSRLDMSPLLRTAPELKTRSAIIGIDENRFTRPGPHVVDAAADLNRIIDQWEKSH